MVKLISRSGFRRLFFLILFVICVYLMDHWGRYSYIKPNDSPVTTINSDNQCNFKSSVDDFLLHYKPKLLLGILPDESRVKPTIERIRNLLEIIRSKEDKYQSLFERFDVFNIINPMNSLKAYSNENNINEIKILYNRFIKLMPDSKTIQIEPTFINYLKKISSYLSDGLRANRMDTVNDELLSSK